MQKVRAKIHLKNIRDNAQTFKAITGKKLCAVVKADAYGHGAQEIAFALGGIADCFAVALIEEGICLQTSALGKDILVFTPPVDIWQAYAFIQSGLVASVGSLHTAKLLQRVCNRYNRSAKIHIKVNTGMNRYGVDFKDLPSLLRFCKESNCLQVKGVYSHLYSKQSAPQQHKIFTQAEKLCRQFYPEICAHLSATGGCLLGKEYAFDMVRVGLGLYGYLPADFAQEPLPLQRGMTVYAQAIQNNVYAFGGVGYGQNRAKKGQRLCLLRVGYADGFLRKKQNGILGKNACALCMDVCIQTGRARRGGWVCVLDNAEDVARQAQTISYEVLCAATRRAERIYDYE